MRLPNTQDSEYGTKQAESEILRDAGGAGLKSGIINPPGVWG